MSLARWHAFACSRPIALNSFLSRDSVGGVPEFRGAFASEGFESGLSSNLISYSEKRGAVDGWEDIMPGQSRIPADFQARTLADVEKFTEKPFNRAAFDKWVAHSTERSRLLRNAFLGFIRWPKSVGRAPGSLASGFSLTLKNHFKTWKQGLGGEDLSEEGDMNMPPPGVWDAADDDKHYRVNYFGYYATVNLNVLYNELNVKIVGSWDNPSKFARFLLPSPLGFHFGSPDGLPILMDEITVDQHFLTAGAPWVVKM